MMKQAPIAPIALTCAMTVVGLAHIQAQQPPTPVDFRPVADGKNWIVKEPLTYQVGISNDRVTVPRGFVTDFATIPPILQSLIQQNGPHLLPAVVHDYLYWKQTCSRDDATPTGSRLCVSGRPRVIRASTGWERPPGTPRGGSRAA